MLNGVALTVIGVANEDFTGTVAGIAPDLWVPFMMVPEVSHEPTWLTRTDSHSVVGLGRLKPGKTEAQAGAELTALTHRYQEDVLGKTPEDGAVLTPSLMVPVPLRGYVKAFTAILMGAVSLVLLIACANAANLQLARAAARRQELAVRSALGAARGRLLRQLLTESLVLSAAAGALGLLLSVWLAEMIVRLLPTNLPLRLSTTLDWRMLAFTAVVSLATGVFFGLVPAFRGARLDIASTLKDAMRGGAIRRSRFAGGLIVGQMALCLVLLLVATLCIRSLFNARSLDPGFETDGRVVASFNLGDNGYTTDESEQFHARLMTRVRTLPEVRSAALAAYLPLGMERSNGTFQFESDDPAGESSGFFERFAVGPGYFATMGTRLAQGREFNDADREGAPRVAIINQAAAEQYWPGRNPIGGRLYAGDSTPGNALEIVGVVQTGRYGTLGENPRPAFFECFTQTDQSRATLVVHAQDDPLSALAAVRNATREIDARLALTSATPLEEHLTLALFPVRISGTLLGVLGIAALILAVSGLFGVIAYSVSQRTREVGIRMALGAQRGDVRRLVLRQGLWLAGLGIGIGLPAALAVTRLLQGLLFGISPTDPVTFLVVPLMLLGVACFACWLPARRAARVDPMVALRSE
jgi:predicted permease